MRYDPAGVDGAVLLIGKSHGPCAEIVAAPPAAPCVGARRYAWRIQVIVELGTGSEYLGKHRYPSARRLRADLVPYHERGGLNRRCAGHGARSKDRSG